MRLNVLQPQAMLAHSQAWLTEPAIRDALLAHSLGKSILAEIQVVHDLLAGMLGQRHMLTITLEKLAERITRADERHDRYARGLYWMLRSLAEVAEIEEEAVLFRNALALLFPTDLAIVRRSYVEEHGAALETEKRITPEVRGLLERTMVHGRPLAALLDRWLAAGKELGQYTRERAQLRSTVQRTGEVTASIDTMSIRNEWIRTGQLFLDIIAKLPLDEGVRRLILAPLEQNIDEAIRRRARNTSNDATAEDDVVDEDGLDEDGLAEDTGGDDAVTDEDDGTDDDSDSPDAPGALNR